MLEISDQFIIFSQVLEIKLTNVACKPLIFKDTRL